MVGWNPTKVRYSDVPSSEGTSIRIENNTFEASPNNYSEREFFNLLKKFIDATYEGHYTTTNDKIQTVDFIVAQSESINYLMGNVLKYVCRYGKKDGHQVKDLLKAVHYIIMMYHFSKTKPKDKINETESKDN